MYLRALNNNAVAKVESVNLHPSTVEWKHEVHMTGLEQNKTYSFEVEDGQERREREGGEGCIGARGYPEHSAGGVPLLVETRSQRGTTTHSTGCLTSPGDAPCGRYSGSR